MNLKIRNLAYFAGVFVILNCNSFPAPGLSSVSSPVDKNLEISQAVEARAEPTKSPDELAAVIPEPKLIEISPSDATDIPDDTLEHIGVWGMGGGGIMAVCMTMEDEITKPQWIEWSIRNGAKYAVTNGDVYFCACGLKDVKGKLTIKDPGGKTQVLKVEEPLDQDPQSKFKCVESSYPVKIGSRLGSYQVNFTQGKIKLTDTFEMALPDAPDGLWLGDALWMAGYQPGQEVRVVGAGGAKEEADQLDPGVVTYSVFLDKKFAVDNFGMLLLTLTPELMDKYGTKLFGVMSETAEPVYVTSIEAPLAETILPGLLRSCSDKFPTRLKKVQNVKAVGSKIPVFPNAYLTPGEENGFLNKGETVQIVTGTVCGLYGNAWKIKREGDGLIGWVNESDEQGYILEPAN